MVQAHSKIPPILHLLIFTLSDDVCIAFAGLFPPNPFINTFILVAVEHLTGQPIATPTNNATVLAVTHFTEKQNIYCVSPPWFVFSVYETCFLATTIEWLMRKFEIQWKPFLVYVPMSSGKTEQMIGTSWKAVVRLIPKEKNAWEEALSKAVYGYGKRKKPHGSLYLKCCLITHESDSDWIHCSRPYYQWFLPCCEKSCIL